MAALLPIVLSVKCKPWRKDDGTTQEADTDFRVVRKDALARDRNTCRFCGFACKPSATNPKADYYMQVHHRDDDHHNNSMANLVTACMHCHACQHIGFYGLHDETILVWLPEMSQATLNHVCRTVLVAKRFYDTTPAAPPDAKKAALQVCDAAQALFSRIRMRSVEAEERYKTSRPSDLASALMLTPPDAYQRRAQTFSGLRLLMLGRHAQGDAPDVMPMIVDSWLGKGGPYAAMKPSSWASFLRELPPIESAR